MKGDIDRIRMKGKIYIRKINGNIKKYHYDFIINSSTKKEFIDFLNSEGYLYEEKKKPNGVISQ